MGFRGNRGRFAVGPVDNVRGSMLLQTLDTFSGASVDTAIWNVTTYGAATPTVSGGQLHQTINATNDSGSQVSLKVYDLKTKSDNSYVEVNVISMAQNSDGNGVGIYVWNTAGTRITLYFISRGTSVGATTIKFVKSGTDILWYKDTVYQATINCSTLSEWFVGFYCRAAGLDSGSYTNIDSVYAYS